MAKFFETGKKMRIKTIFLLLGLILSLTHCSSYDFSRRVVKQGNLVSSAKVNRLKLGMSKDEVAILMGTSLMSPTFNNDRWDYAYTWRKGTDPLKVCSLSLYFHNNALVKIERHH
jgi:outer membrane protein assembly factor BamE